MKGKELNIIKVPLPENKIFKRPLINFEPFDELFLDLIENKRKVKPRKRGEKFNYENFHEKMRKREKSKLNASEVSLFKSPPLPNTPSNISIYSRVSTRKSHKVNNKVRGQPLQSNNTEYNNMKDLNESRLLAKSPTPNNIAISTNETSTNNKEDSRLDIPSTPSTELGANENETPDQKMLEETCSQKSFNPRISSASLNFGLCNSPGNIGIGIGNIGIGNIGIGQTEIHHLKDIKIGSNISDKFKLPSENKSNSPNNKIIHNHLELDDNEEADQDEEELTNDDDDMSSVQSYFSEHGGVQSVRRVIKTVLSNPVSIDSDRGHTIRGGRDNRNSLASRDKLRDDDDNKSFISSISSEAKSKKFSVKSYRQNSFKSDIVHSVARSVKSNYSVSEDDEKRELLFKFQLLSSKNPMLVAKYPFNMRSDVKVMRNTYKMIMKQISVNNKVDNLNTYLLAGFMGCEYVFGKLGFDMEGFSKHQIASMKSYEALLVELGEKEYTPYGMDKWSVEVRLLATLVFNAFWFIVAKSISKKTNFDLTGMLNTTNSENIIENGVNGVTNENSGTNVIPQTFSSIPGKSSSS